MLTLFKSKNEHRDVKLLGKKNRPFLDGKHGELDRRKEVYRNIDRRMWLEPPENYRSCGIFAIGCTSSIGALLFLSGGIVFVMGGITFIQRMDDLKWALYLDDTGMLLAAIMAGVYGISTGYPYFLKAYLMITHLMYATQIYEELKQKGQVVYGEIVDLRAGSGIQINYQFSPPGSEDIVEGRYFTAAVFGDFHIGDKIAVLYLNRHIHILL